MKIIYNNPHQVDISLEKTTGDQFSKITWLNHKTETKSHVTIICQPEERKYFQQMK